MPTPPRINAPFLAPTLPMPVDNNIKSLSPYDAIEYSPAFLGKLHEALNQAKLRGPAESGFWMGASGGYAPITTVQGREVHIRPAPTAKLVAHTHPTWAGAVGRPSDNDIQQARKLGIPLLTASDQGVFETDGSGKTTQLFNGAGWESSPLLGRIRLK